MRVQDNDQWPMVLNLEIPLTLGNVRAVMVCRVVASTIHHLLSFCQYANRKMLKNGRDR
jgi:hypothetical protein